LRTLGQTVELDDQLLERLVPQANNLHPREVVHLIETLGDAQREIRDGLDARLQLELALVKVTRPQLDHTAAALEERLRRLEAGTAAPAPSAPAARPAAPAAKSPAAEDGGRKPAKRPAAPVASAAPAGEPAGDGEATAAPAAADTPPAAETPPAELTLERVKRAWELILQRVQSSSVSLYAMLRDARPSNLDGERLTVTIPSNFALSRACEQGNAELLASAVESALGQPLQPDFVLAAGASAASNAAPEPAAPAAMTLDYTALIKQAKGTFDAEEMPDDS
jgi:DNA polymerase-3 subunit gamma/tau